jgi:hypothetical protein
VGRRLDEPVADDARDLDERAAGLFRCRLLPHQPAIVWRKGLEHEREISTVHRPHALAELGQVLAMLEALEKIALGTLLAMRQRFEHAVLVEQTRHFVEALLKTRFGSDRRGGGHGGLPVA